MMLVWRCCKKYGIALQSWRIAEFSTHSICRSVISRGHDHDDNMLFNSEWSRVKGHAKERNLRQIASPCFANRVSKKEGDELHKWVRSAWQTRFQWTMKTSLDNWRSRISEIEELVETSDKGSTNDADDPSTESRRGHHRIIHVGDSTSNFNVRRFVL
jgi:hypothetical protein